MTRPLARSFPLSQAGGTQGGGNFTQFRNRFMATEVYAGKNSKSGSNFWYSFERNLVHWVAFTSETWTMSEEQIATQLAWLKADLASVDRSRTPWVLAYSHKNWDHDNVNWTSSGIADALHVGGVDAFWCGHWVSQQ